MKYQIPFIAVVMLITLFYAFGRQERTRKRVCVTAVTVLMTLFSGLRSWWMGDLIKYYTQYRSCNGPEWRDTLFSKLSNIGLRLFFHYGGTIGLSYEVCIFIIAAFSAITLGVLVFRYSPSPYFSYLIYIAMGFFIFTYSGLKQTIAMGFLCIAMIGLLEGRFWLFLIWTIVGGMFHAPAFIFLPAFFFARKRIDAIYVLIILTLIVMVFLFRNRLVSLLTDLYYEDEAEYALINVFGGRFLMMLFILALGIFLRPLRQSDTIYLYIFNLMVLAAALQSFSVYGNNFSRLADYYYQFIVLFIPLMMQPGSSQAVENPLRVHEIRYISVDTYFLIGIGITLFALWYYSGYVKASAPIVKDFKFLWQIDAHALYGA